MKYKSIFLLFLFGSLAGSVVWGQAPSNDDYTGAVALTVNPEYLASSMTAGTTVGATMSSQASCTGFPAGSGHDDDVWYKFTATKASHIVSLSNITSGNNSYTAHGVEIFRSDENGLTARINCTDNGFTYYSGSEVLLTGLTINETYFVRVYGRSTWSGVPDRINFNISILTPPNPPANDEYTGAVNLTPNPDYVCTNAVAGTTDGATQSPQAACQTGRNDDDVWYKFTATRVSHIVKLSGIALVRGYNAQRHIEVFKSNGNAPAERIACTGDSDTEVLLSGLTSGDSYFIRVYAYDDYASFKARINFNICILSPVDPPANNEYINATALTVNPGAECTGTTPGTTDGATQSLQDACHAENSDDVWFKFTALKASHIVKLTNISLAYGTQNGSYAEIFSSAGGLPVNRIFCSSLPNFTETTLTGLTIGESYFVRIYTGAGLHRINFNICVSTPPVPANDDCAAAVDISNGSQASGTTNGATQSMSAGSCAGNGTAYDVWYKVIPISGGALTVVANTSQFDLVLEAFTGTCAGLTSISCKNDAVGSESLTIANALAGTAYYFRVYNYTPAAAGVAAETGAFTIQVSGGALPVTLASFKATSSESNSVRLDWVTTQEAGAGHFEVEHSLTGRTWSKIGELKAAGNNTGLKSYTYIHTNPSLSVNYYRLKSVDLDGTYVYSAIENVRPGTQPGGSTKELFVYPNPAHEYLTLEIGDQREIRSLKLFNAAGNEVFFKLDSAGRSLDVRHLPAGSYLLHISRNDSSVQTFRIVISR